MDSSINKVDVKVQRRSGFDKSFMSIGSGKVGQLIPIFFDEVLPNSKLSVKLAMNASLPPLANDVYMRCSIKTEAFFVPMRLLSGGFQAWFSGVPDTLDGTKAQLPYLTIDPGDSEDWVGILNYCNDSGNLFDWLGMRVGHVNQYDAAISPDSVLTLSYLPFLAYHKIYDDWYRKPLIQRPAFCRPLVGTQVPRDGVKFMPFVYTDQSFSETIVVSAADFRSIYLNDNWPFFKLRQRNFGDDQFTVAQTSPQLGDAQSVRVADGNFTISALRAANSMQQFEEFNQLAGSRFQDQLRVRYGASLSDGVAQRALFLGSGEFEVYSKGVFQAANDAASNPRNPYNSVGSRYGSAYASGQEFIINNFHAQEPGYIFVIASLVPRRSYQNTVAPWLDRYVANRPSSVMPNARLQNVGNEAIPVSRFGIMSSLPPFGYQQRFSDMMYRNDEVHGQLRKGGKLQYFALSEYIDWREEEFEISSAFLRIPDNYLDSVFAVAPVGDEPAFWFDCFFEYKISQPLAKYSIPSLQDPAYEHGDTVTVKRGGLSL